MLGTMRLACRIILGAAILCAISTLAHAAALTSVRLTWDAPTENPEYITNYQVRWSLNADGSNGTLYDAGITLGAVIDNLPPQRVFFHVRAVDFLGQEGEWSGNTTYSVKPSVPATMGGMKVMHVELQR